MTCSISDSIVLHGALMAVTLVLLLVVWKEANSIFGMQSHCWMEGMNPL